MKKRLMRAHVREKKHHVNKKRMTFFQRQCENPEIRNTSVEGWLSRYFVIDVPFPRNRFSQKEKREERREKKREERRDGRTTIRERASEEEKKKRRRENPSERARIFVENSSIYLPIYLSI